MTILSNAKLRDLDAAMKDRYGKAPADYLSERIILADNEIGIHEAFQQLIANHSTSSLSGVNTQHPSSTCTAYPLDHQDKIQNVTKERIPGAYPSIDEE